MTPHSDDVDLFVEEVLEDPYPVYRRLRQLGDVVWLPSCQAYALTRHKIIRQAILDARVFSSAQGVSLNEDVNEYQKGTMLGSDPPVHTRLRGMLADAFSPAAVREMESEIESSADALVAKAVASGYCDAAQDIAAIIPTEVISDIIGLPRTGRSRMLQLGHNYFNAFGFNAPNMEGGPKSRITQAWTEMQTASAYIGFMAQRLVPGKLGAKIFSAVDTGELDKQQAFKMLTTLIGAGADTTVRTIGNAVRCFADHPEQWQLLCKEPHRVQAAVNEVLRYDSPSQMLARYVTCDTEISGYDIPQGSRVLLLYASGNRDELAFSHADQFDITRDPRPGHLSFSSGIHMCLGHALARLEVQGALKALMRHVERIELDGAPTRRINSVLRGYGTLPVRMTLRRTTTAVSALETA